jgi:3',5'-cyclic AMP phosphodiesterase CpdA
MTYVLAHLSDPHLAPLPPPRLHELIGKRVTGFIHWRRKRQAIHQAEVLARIVADLKAQKPDHIAVTGDLVNLALPAEYAPARVWLDALGAPADVTLVPGNHDAYVRSGVAASLSHWGDYMRGDEAVALAQDRPHGFPFVRKRGSLALIGASTSEASLPLLATGRLGSDQLRRLERILDEARAEGRYRVVLIHHPPTTRRGHYLKRLTDGAQLRDVLARHGAELVIHGHNHRRQTVWLDGPQGRIPAIGVPSASEALPGEHDPAGYNLYRIDGSPGAWRCEVVTRGLTSGGVAELDRTVLESR